MSRQADFTTGVYQPPCLAASAYGVEPDGAPEAETDCEVCDEGIYLDHEDTWQHVGTGPMGEGYGHEGEPRMCGEIVFTGSRNPDASNFGPDEGCEDLVAPGSEYCARHANSGER
jgi:hypothetical protein